MFILLLLIDYLNSFSELLIEFNPPWSDFQPFFLLFKIFVKLFRKQKMNKTILVKLGKRKRERERVPFITCVQLSHVIWIGLFSQNIILLCECLPVSGYKRRTFGELDIPLDTHSSLFSIRPLFTFGCCVCVSCIVLIATWLLSLLSTAFVISCFNTHTVFHVMVVTHLFPSRTLPE